MGISFALAWLERVAAGIACVVATMLVGSKEKANLGHLPLNVG